MPDASMVTQFQIDPVDLHRTRIVEIARPALAPGQVRFRVDAFALTANNITYVRSSGLLGYLDFFPVADAGPWRLIPVMGHGEIIESAHPDIEAGGRYFGFFPMASEHVLTAEPRGMGVRDAGEHRVRHAATYRQFDDVRRNPQYDPAREDAVALLRGLFVTSFLVEDFLFDNANFGATDVLVTSASSKTSIALGHSLRKRGTRAIGLTSARHVDAVRALGCYDDVIGYDDITLLDAATPSVVVDMAGDGAILARIHGHFGDNLKFSSAVGITHHEAPARTDELPDPRPKFFFAPSQIEKRAQEWGGSEFATRLGAAFADFADFASGWLSVTHSRGAAAAQQAYLEVLEGRSAPTTGHIVSLRAG